MIQRIGEQMYLKVLQQDMGFPTSGIIKNIISLPMDIAGRVRGEQHVRKPPATVSERLGCYRFLTILS